MIPFQSALPITPASHPNRLDYSLLPTGWFPVTFLLPGGAGDRGQGILPVELFAVIS